jgi:hypothetical protein
MKRILAAALVVLSSLFAPQLTAASAVKATLTLPHDNVLPGVPFDLVVTYTNVSDRPVTVSGALATLVVTLPGGDTIVVNKPDVNDQWDITLPVRARLEPGQSVEQAVGWEHGLVPNWFHYSAPFSGPGTYGIALDLHISDGEKNVLGAVRTPAVTLTRVVPTGIDAELWQRMQEISGGAWTDDAFLSTKVGVALAEDIAQVHPASGYYPYVLALRAFGPPGKKHIPALLEAAERFTGSPAHPYLLEAAANSARYEAWKAEQRQDLAAAQTYFILAQTIYRRALATNSVAVRASSEVGLRDVAQGFERAKKPAR